MASVTQVPADLFGDKMPSLDSIKNIAIAANSSEINKINLEKLAQENIKNTLPAGIAMAILGKNDQAVKLLTKAKDSLENSTSSQLPIKMPATLTRPSKTSTSQQRTRQTR
ncbi:MAG: hypothetical protein KAS23_01610 [Anaerohalosphaera sp.]|nr:hypothetical protein [Anaerohalosphaera sp.]